MAFDDLMLNRVSRRPGMARPTASGERAMVYDAESGVVPRLTAVERELEELRTKRDSRGAGIILGGSGRVPTAPTDLQVVSQDLVQDAHGQTWVEVTVSWTGTADLFEVAIARSEI